MLHEVNYFYSFLFYLMPFYFKKFGLAFKFCFYYLIPVIGLNLVNVFVLCILLICINFSLSLYCW